MWPTRPGRSTQPSDGAGRAEADRPAREAQLAVEALGTGVAGGVSEPALNETG